MTKQKFIPKSVPKIRNFQDALVALVLIQDKKIFSTSAFLHQNRHIGPKLRLFNEKVEKIIFFIVPG